MAHTQLETKPPVRIGELDGLRGWASLSVVFYHLIYKTLDALIPDIRNIITASLFNGEFAVMIFFVLSGDALSTPFWKSNHKWSVLTRLTLKRYPRLTLPILCACLIQTALLYANFSGSAQAGALLNEDYLTLVNTKPEQLGGFLYYTLIGVYISPLNSPIIPHLWTMRSEMIGSICVFTFLYISRWISWPKTIALAICIALVWFNAIISCFFFGIVLAKLRSENRFTQANASKFTNSGAIVGFVVCLVACGYLNLIRYDARLYYMIFSMAICLCVALSHTLKSLFSAPLSAFLGRISFPLYLVHYSILVGVFSNLVVATHSTWRESTPSLILIALFSIACAIGLAVVFQPVDRLSMWVGERLCRFIAPKPRV